MENGWHRHGHGARKGVVYHDHGRATIGFATVGTKVYGDGEDDVNGTQLWVSAGTASTTKPAAAIQTGPAGTLPQALFVRGGRIYFQATTTTYGNEIWAYKY